MHYGLYLTYKLRISFVVFSSRFIDESGGTA